MEIPDLDAIEHDCKDSKKCLRRMLSLWLTKTTPSPPRWWMLSALVTLIDEVLENVSSKYTLTQPQLKFKKIKVNNHKILVLKCPLNTDFLTVCRFIRRANGNPKNKNSDIAKDFY